MARVLEDPDVLEEAVGSVMDAPFPVVDAVLLLERLTSMLTRANAAVLVRHNGEITGIVTRYDLVRTLTGVS